MVRKILILCLIFIISFTCNAQEKLKLRYIECQFVETKNNSFISQVYKFVNSNNDTIKINNRITFDINNPMIINKGFYYGCALKEDSIYTIELKRICIKDIPKTHHNYYRFNAVFAKRDCSKFTDKRKNTNYKGFKYYGIYVDIDYVLYEIIGIEPDDDCFY